MEAAKIAVTSRKGLEDLHVLKQAVVGKESMGHSNAMGLHGVTLAIIVIADFWIVEIANLSLNPIRSSRRKRIATSVHC
jgi:hypothetical protein